MGAWGFADFGGPPADAAWIRQAALSLGVTLSGEPDGRCMFGSYSEAAVIQQAHESQQGLRHPFLTLVADAQLHNRDDLIQSLGLPPAAPYSDGELILASYAKWRDGCPAVLLGEFAFAVWDSQNEELFLCRDHMGFRPLFYWQGGARFVFASDPRSILQVPGVQRALNRRKLAAMAVSGGQHLYPQETFHEGILSVPCATWLRVDRHGVRQTRYWEPEVRANLVPGRPEEAFEALRDLLFRAVKCRMSGGGRVAALLSGGLDSSTVVSIAARCLGGGNRSLTALSAVLPEEMRTRVTDEREFIDEYRLSPHVEIQYLTAAGSGPFDLIEDSSRFAITPLRTSRHFLYEAFDRAAASMGCHVVLEGDGGEMGPTYWGDGYYLELLARLRWITLAVEMAKSWGIEGVSPLRALHADLVSILPGPYRRSAPLAHVCHGDL